jgi:hypothetical protein
MEIDSFFSTKEREKCLWDITVRAEDDHHGASRNPKPIVVVEKPTMLTGNCEALCACVPRRSMVEYKLYDESAAKQ